MAFKPRIVGGTDTGDIAKPREVVPVKDIASERVKVLTEKIVSPIIGDDPLANVVGVFIDRAFDKKIGLVLDTVESLENSRPKNRSQVWLQGRKAHNLIQETDANLKAIIMNADIGLIPQKPEYFTAVCGEIMERVLGNIPRVK